MFSIIIPNYNNAKYLDKMFHSIYTQTFQDYEIIFVDDVSTDNSVEIARDWKIKYFKDKMKLIIMEDKAWNGGARNVGLANQDKDRDYTLFLDSDDTFDGEDCLQTIVDIIKTNNYPDCIRLSYNWCGDEVRHVDLSEQNTPELLASVCDVACWTKCIKTHLIVEFPMNTLMEDAIQHLQQVDQITTVVGCKKAIVNWNRQNPNSCSTNGQLQNGKWLSSFYRYFADLLDLQLEKSYTKDARQFRIEDMKKAIKINIKDW